MWYGRDVMFTARSKFAFSFSITALYVGVTLRFQYSHPLTQSLIPEAAGRAKNVYNRPKGNTCRNIKRYLLFLINPGLPLPH